MEDPITATVFFGALRQHSEALRAEMKDGFKDLGSKLDAHQRDDKAVADRVLVIEIERAGEKTQTLKRGTAIALFASMGFTALLEALKALAKK